MRAGGLDQRITIQTYTKSRGTSGEPVQTWTDWMTVWASVQTTGGNETFYSPQLVAEATHKLLTRYFARPGSKWQELRIIWRDRILDVVYVDESRQRQGELYWLCKEMVTP